MTLHIVNGVPGSGKTKKIEQIFLNNPDLKKIYLTSSHFLLDERKLYFDGLDVTHWKGFDRTCPMLKIMNPTKYQRLIQVMTTIKSPTEWRCQICQHNKLISIEDCPHKQQFTNPENIVLAPDAYLWTHRIRDYNPDIVVVDDVDLLKTEDLPTLEEMNRWLTELSKIGTKRGFISSFEELKDFYALYIKSEKLLQKELTKLKRKLKDWTVEMLNEKHKLPTRHVKAILKIDPTNIYDWCRLVQIYGWQENFSMVQLMELFKLTTKKEREVYIVGSLPNRDFIKSLAYQFKLEYRKKLEFTYEEIKLEKKANSIIYRFQPKRGAWYPHIRSIRDSPQTRSNLKQNTKMILEYLFEIPKWKKVAIIRQKDVPVEKLIGTNLVEHVEALHYGDLRGSNTLEDFDVLFIYGTYVMNLRELQKEFVKVFRREPTTLDSVKLSEGGYRYVDPDLEAFRCRKEDNEVYQAIHRIRPALRDKIVVIFGRIPKEIYNEGFEIKHLTKEGYEIVEEDIFSEQLDSMIGDGEYLAKLVKELSKEFDLTVDYTREKIKRWVKQNKNIYALTMRKGVGEREYIYVQRKKAVLQETT